MRPEQPRRIPKLYRRKSYFGGARKKLQVMVGIGWDPGRRQSRMSDTHPISLSGGKRNGGGGRRRKKKCALINLTRGRRLGLVKNRRRRLRRPKKRPAPPARRLEAAKRIRPSVPRMGEGKVSAKDHTP